MNIFDLIIVQPIFNLLLGIYSIVPGGDFGITIIIFTILLRFALYPLVVKQLHQVKAMRKLQPKLEQIKRQTKGNKQLQSLQMMELYKEHGVNPFRSIGILIIQLPIFIALYHVIQIITLHRDQVGKYVYDFLHQVPAINQIIEHPEQFNEKLLGFVDLTKPALGSHIDLFLVVLAVLAAATQLIMSKQTMPHTTSKRKIRDILKEAADGKEADQSEINNIIMSRMMYVLPVFMLFIMLSLPGALALYYAVSNIVATIQQHFILKRDEEELDEIASHVQKQQSGKKAAKAKSREKTAKTAQVVKSPSAKVTKKSKAKRDDTTVVRIVASDSKKGKK